MNKSRCEVALGLRASKHHSPNKASDLDGMDGHSDCAQNSSIMFKPTKPARLCSVSSTNISPTNSTIIHRTSPRTTRDSTNSIEMNCSMKQHQTSRSESRSLCFVNQTLFARNSSVILQILFCLFMLTFF